MATSRARPARAAPAMALALLLAALAVAGAGAAGGCQGLHFPDYADSPCIALRCQADGVGVLCMVGVTPWPDLK